MKKLLLIIFSLTLINCEKDGVGEDDPIRATWLGEFESEDYNGDTAYFQVVYKFNDDLLDLDKFKKYFLIKSNSCIRGS